MPLKCRDIRDSLTSKGFQQRDGSHQFFHLIVEGKMTPILTFMSHGEREIHEGLISTMARQLKLKKPQFCSLVECSLSHSGYVKILKADGHIKGDC